MSSGGKRILIADDHEIVRLAVKRLLCRIAPDAAVIDVVPSGTILSAVESSRPDLVILGCNLSEYEGLALIRAIQQCCSDARILIFTSMRSSRFLHRLRLVGVQGIVLKSDDLTELEAAARALLQERHYFGGNVLDCMSSDQATLLRQLSETEHRVLERLAMGKSNLDIASELDLRGGDIRGICSALMRKFDAESRVELRQKTYESGVVDRLGSV